MKTFGRMNAISQIAPTKNMQHLEDSWSQVNSASFAWRVSLWAVMLIGGVWIACVSHGGMRLLGIVLLGAAMAHGVELEHQTLHHTGFRAPFWNELFGILMGLPMLVSFHEYRINHLKHHAFLGTPENREFFDYGLQAWTTKGVLIRLFMPLHYTEFLKNLVRACRGKTVGNYPNKYAAKVKQFYYLSIAMVSIIGFACWWRGDMVPAITWIGALVFIAAPIHALVELPEHYGCSSDSTCVFRNTRTIRSNWFMTWFTNSNNFHVEHHCWPKVPLQKIQQLHSRCYSSFIHTDAGYLDFYLNVWKKNRSDLAA